MTQVSAPVTGGGPVDRPHERPPTGGGLVDPDRAREVQHWFAALADATRVRILQALSLAPEWCVGDLARAVGLSVSTLSHQLHYLIERGIVTRRPQGRRVFYALSDEHVRHVLLDALAHVGEGKA